MIFLLVEWTGVTVEHELNSIFVVSVIQWEPLERVPGHQEKFETVAAGKPDHQMREVRDRGYQQRSGI